MHDDLGEMEPHLSDHPFQPDTCWTPVAVDEHGWRCGYTSAEHTHSSGEEAPPGQDGMGKGGTRRRRSYRVARVSR
jgi:hypothetical protein